jgi:hypothetical protein
MTTKQINMLTNGKELRQFTHVNDISDALIAIMEYFDESPYDIDITDGNWLKLVDLAETIQKAIPGCELNVSSKPAKVQKRHEANLTSEWHQTRWRQNLTFDDGVSEIIERTREFLNVSESEPAVTIVVDCGPAINETVIESLQFIVTEIDKLKAPLTPMKIEILAASRALAVDEAALPCQAVIQAGHYRRKAVRLATSKTVCIMDFQTLPTLAHMYFFQRGIPRDLIFYFADYVYVDSLDQAHGETNGSIATFSMITDCENELPKPQDLSFIIATRETWIALKVPPDGVNVNDWLMRLVPGYIAIKFESPVWRWGPRIEPLPSNLNICRAGTAAKLPAVIPKANLTVYNGSRPRVQ